MKNVLAGRFFNIIIFIFLLQNLIIADKTTPPMKETHPNYLATDGQSI